MSERAARGGRRKRRSRPRPRWLSSSEQIDPVAKARCLMVLSVLSGEKPVSEAIEQAGISRGRYYQLESRALGAMVKVLGPEQGEIRGRQPSPARRIAILEAKVKRLEQARRRALRLLHLTGQLSRAGRRKGWKTVSTKDGSTRLPSLGRRKRKLASTPEATGVAEP